MKSPKCSNIQQYFVFVCFLFLSVTQAQEVSETQQQGQPVIIEAGSEGTRSFGDLDVVYQLDKDGKKVICILYVSTQLVGVKTLLPEAPVYDFEVQLGVGKAKGTIMMLLTSSNQVSSLNGNFTYTTASGNNPFIFKGVLVGWYTSKDR